MKFSRSFIGYSPSEVHEKENQIITRINKEEQEIKQELEIATKEHEQLLSQKDVLSVSLDVIRGSMTLMDKYQMHFSSTSLLKAKKDGQSKVEEMVREREIFLSEIEEKISQLDSEINKAKTEILSVNKAIDEVMNLFKINVSLDEKILSIDNLIQDYSKQASLVEPYNVIKAADIGQDILQMLLNENAEIMAESMTETASTSSSLAPQETSNFTNQVKSLSHSHTQIDQLKKPVVLVAENDRETATLLHNILEREGFEVIIAADGYAVSNMIKEKEPPDVVLLNTFLPFFDGNQLIKQIRTSQVWQDVPIIVLTPEHSKQSIIEVLECGANDSLEKPFNPRELVARVKRLSVSYKKS